MNIKYKHNALRLLATTLAVGMIIAATGCGASGPPRGAVSGTVLINSEPLPEGVVRFIPEAPNEGPKTSVVVANGKFHASQHVGPVVGVNRVEIESTDNGGYAPDDEKALVQLKKTRNKIRVLRVPAVYNERSKLTEIIRAGQENHLQFKLTTNPKNRRIQ